MGQGNKYQEREEMYKSIGCSRVRGKLHETNQDNLELLSTRMGANIPRECINDVISFSSRSSEYNLPNIYEYQPGNATVAADEILQQIVYTLSQNHENLSWDDKSIAVFKLGLGQEIVTLVSCLHGGMENTRNAVRKYFRQINKLLKDKDYSECAWRIVQMEIRQSIGMVKVFP
uniref:Uncharacterized protein n=1 Tax=Anolis carolinensis TaxID=28377 RepID=A0A803TBV4_ANOCA